MDLAFMRKGLKVFIIEIVILSLNKFKVTAFKI